MSQAIGAVALRAAPRMVVRMRSFSDGNFGAGRHRDRRGCGNSVLDRSAKAGACYPRSRVAAEVCVSTAGGNSFGVAASEADAVVAAASASASEGG
jgi:hypothetical protein